MIIPALALVTAGVLLAIAIVLVADPTRRIRADAAILRTKLNQERDRRIQAEWARDTLKNLLDRRAKRSSVQ